MLGRFRGPANEVAPADAPAADAASEENA
jgi:hypothetical protein